MIPKVIHLTYKDHNIPNYVIPTWESLNPGYTIKFYTDEDCQKYLLENYDVKHLDMFNFLKDGPIKADFFRLCVLLKEGGYYCDIDAQPLVSFDSFIDPTVNFMTVLSKPSNGLVNPHILVCLPGHKIIEQTKNTYFIYLSTKVQYSYHKYSIVPIMGNIIYKLLGEKPPMNLRINGPWVICSDHFKVKEGVYNLPTGKTQFIQEQCPKDQYSCYCSYKGIYLIMNRYTDYKNHKYESS